MDWICKCTIYPLMMVRGQSTLSGGSRSVGPLSTQIRSYMKRVEASQRRRKVAVRLTICQETFKSTVLDKIRDGPVHEKDGRGEGHFCHYHLPNYW